MSTLQNAMRPTASFNLKNESNESARICLFPGHFDTTEVVSIEGGKVVLAYSNPEGIVSAGFACDQVADDCSEGTKDIYIKDRGGKYTVKVTPVSKRTRYRDFLNYIKLKGLRVTKIRITDLTANSQREIFSQEMEVSASAIGQKAGSDFVQFATYRSANYDQSFIEIDLEERNLLLNATTLAALDIPAGNEIQIDFTLSK